MRKLLLLFALLCSLPVAAQVSPYPFLEPQFLNNSGQPCSGCLLNTYQAGTTTPLVTYSDALGTIPNANPIVLNAFGRAFIFLSSSAYKFVLTTSGGTLLWSIDNITSSNLSLLSSNNVWTGTNTFNAGVTFNVAPLFNVGLTSNGPNALGGGGSLSGTYSGSPIFSGVPNFSGGFSAAGGSFTATTGTPPFTVSSTTQVPNLDASFLEGCTWEIPCPIGVTSPSTAKFTTMSCSTSCTIDGVTISGTPTAGQVITASSGTVAGWSSVSVTSVQSFQQTLLGADVPVAASTITPVMSRAVTMPASGCPCRVFISYSTWITTASSGAGYSLWISDATNVMAPVSTGQSNGSGGAQTSANYSGFSPVTYANSANVTFTLNTEGDHTYTVKAAQSIGSGPSSSLQISIFTSN
jgi:hypothetical protein